MAKHTKGPWRVRSTETIHLIEAEALKSFTGTRVFVAEIHFWSNGHGPSREQALANAHLIAAAPDLLEACRYIVEAGETGDEMRAIELARAALSKAEG